MIFEPALYIYQSPVGSDYIRDLYEITAELGFQRRDKKNEKSSDVPTILFYASPWDEVKLYDIMNSHEKLSEQPYNVRIKRHVTPVYVDELYNQFRMYKKKGVNIQGIVMDDVVIEERCGETLQHQLLCFIQWAGIPVVVKQEVKYGEEKNLVEYK